MGRTVYSWKRSACSCERFDHTLMRSVYSLGRSDDSLGKTYYFPWEQLLISRGISLFSLNFSNHSLGCSDYFNGIFSLGKCDYSIEGLVTPGGDLNSSWRDLMTPGRQLLTSRGDLITLLRQK